MRRQDTAVWRGLRVTSKSRSEAGLLSQDLAGAWQSRESEE